MCALIEVNRGMDLYGGKDIKEGITKDIWVG